MATKKAQEKEKINIDEALDRLDEINQKLSDKDIALSDAIALYQEGVKVAAACKENLAGLEKTLETITP